MDGVDFFKVWIYSSSVGRNYGPGNEITGHSSVICVVLQS